eukprot:3558966-Pleurochrysis_carterae.AAC.1
MQEQNLKFASIYAPADARERTAFFHAIRSLIDPSTILCGDFNCVDDPSVDTRRSSNLKYSNEGAEILSEIVTQNGLRDEIREQMGVDFEFTHAQKTPTGGYCLSRLDKHYLPDLSNCQWTSEISDKIDDTDHSMVMSTITFINEKDQTRGKDLFTINSQVIHDPEVRTSLLKAINEVNIKHKKDPSRVQHTVLQFKYTIRNILKKATKVHAKKINSDIEQINELLNVLHASQIRKPTADGTAARNRLLEERV